MSRLSRRFFARFALSLCFVSVVAHAAPSTGKAAPSISTLIQNLSGGRVLFQEGPVDERHSPCSSFKIAIALMAFDAGILKGPHEPLLDYRPEYQAGRDADKIAIDPSAWLRNSVVWYSQQATLKLGKARFEKYVKNFHYGNGDCLGHPGKNDGLTQAWLMSSLQVSPREQVRFLKALLEKKLPVSETALALTIATVPIYPAEGGWTVHGKSGSGYLAGPDGNAIQDRPLGWFVGWAEKDARRVVFARFESGIESVGLIYGARARSAVLSNLAGMVGRE
jgi:beta-lactamase class D